jgi:serine/threonine protein kinase
MDIRSGSDDRIETPYYSPPEQFDPNAPQGAWIDIFSLGATLYEMLDATSNSICRRAYDSDWFKASFRGSAALGLSRNG